METEGNATENQQRSEQGAGGRAVEEGSRPRSADRERTPDADPDADWLAALDALIGIADDRSADLRGRLGAVGAAGGLADEVFERRLPHETPTERHDAPGGCERPRPLTEDVGQRMDQIGQILHASILPALAQQESINVVGLGTVPEADRQRLHARFRQQIFPLLTPLAVDSGRPFPHLESGGLTLLTVLHSQGADLRYDSPVFALIQIPDVLERWLSVAAAGRDALTERWFDTQSYGPGSYVWSESVVRAHVGLLFPGMSVAGAYLLRVQRSDRRTAEDGGRRSPSRDTVLPIVRLDVEQSMPSGVRQWLTRHLAVSDQALVRSHPPMAMADLTPIADRLSLRRRGLRGWLHGAVDLFFGHI